MYTIIVKYFNLVDKEIYIEEVKEYSIQGATHVIERGKNYSLIVLSASYKDECAVIRDSISEE